MSSKITASILITSLIITSCGVTSTPSETSPSSNTEILSRISNEGIQASIEEFENLKKTSPNIDESEYIRIVNKNISKYPALISPQGTPYGYGNIATQVNDLYPQEKQLCDQSAYECSQVMVAGADGHRFSRDYVSFQSHTTDNELDAFRHAMWNASMTQKIGFARAKLWGDAHEYGNPRRIPNALNEQMDLHNNAVGRNIGNEPTFGFPGEYAASVIKTAIKSGRLQIFARAYPTEVVPSGSYLVPSNSYSSSWPNGW